MVDYSPALMTDMYEYTMLDAALKDGTADRKCVFEVFTRHLPEGRRYGVVAGTGRILDALEHFHLDEADLKFLADRHVVSPETIKWLENFHFSGTIRGYREGEMFFPNSPILQVEGTFGECTLLETLILSVLNYDSAVASAASRMASAAKDRPCMDMGGRRTNEWAAVAAARAAVVGGFKGTANLLAAQLYGLKAIGTAAHCFTLVHDSERDAFESQIEALGKNTTLLVDTYNVLRHGVPDAIKVFDEVLKPMGKRPKGIRIDSGDIAYLSKKARKMLDEAGYPDCTICASNSLDEYIVRDLILQGARVDSFGIGENMITAKSDPVFGGVYKLAAVREDDGSYTPKMKLSESAEKMTIPCLKKVWRIYDQDGKAMADLITMADEVVETQHGITLFDPIETWKECTYVNCTARCLSTPIYENGKRVYSSPSLDDIKKFCKAQVNTLWDEVKRFENPHRYYVDLSQKLWDTRSALLKKLSK